MLPFAAVKGIMLKESCLPGPSPIFLQIQLCKSKYRNLSPSQRAWLVRASSRCNKVAISIPSRAHIGINQ